MLPIERVIQLIIEVFTKIDDIQNATKLNGYDIKADEAQIIKTGASEVNEPKFIKTTVNKLNEIFNLFINIIEFFIIIRYFYFIL